MKQLVFDLAEHAPELDLMDLADDLMRGKVPGHLCGLWLENPRIVEVPEKEETE
jgi:hypothetical protein